MLDRKLVVYQLVGDTFTFIDFANPKASTSSKVSQDFKETFLDPNTGFEIILIGLDGGIKLRQGQILTQQALFNRIDSMPMRSSELRNRTKP